VISKERYDALDDETKESLRLFGLIVEDAANAERRRCVKVLTELFDNALPDAFRDGIEASIAALNPTTEETL
jgi:hypothetical protein